MPGLEASLDLITTGHTSVQGPKFHVDIISLQLMQQGIIPRDSNVFARVFASVQLANQMKNPVIPSTITFHQAGQLAERAYQGALSTFNPVAGFTVHRSTDADDFKLAQQTFPIDVREIAKIFRGDQQSLDSASRNLGLSPSEVISRLNASISGASQGRVTTVANDQGKLLVVTAAGTDFYNKYNLYDDVVHIPFGSPGKYLPPRMQSAVSQALRESITPSSPYFGYKVVLVGHSLSGTNVSYFSDKFHLPAFAFDPVNTQRVNAGNGVQPGQLASVIGIDNILNTLGPLAGDVHRVGLSSALMADINSANAIESAVGVLSVLNPIQRKWFSLGVDLYTLNLSHPISHIVPQLEGYNPAQMQQQVPSTNVSVSSVPTEPAVEKTTLPPLPKPAPSQTSQQPVLVFPTAKEVASAFIANNQFAGGFSTADTVYAGGYAVPTAQSFIPQGMSASVGFNSRGGLQGSISTSVWQHVPLLAALPVGVALFEEFFSSDLQNAQRHYINAANSNILDIFTWNKDIKKLRKNYVAELKKELKKYAKEKNQNKYQKTQELLSTVDSDLSDEAAAHLHDKRERAALQHRHQLYREQKWKEGVKGFQESLQQGNAPNAANYIEQLNEVDPFAPQVVFFRADLALANNNPQQAWQQLEQWGNENSAIINPTFPSLVSDQIADAYQQQRLQVAERLVKSTNEVAQKSAYFSQYAELYKERNSFNKKDANEPHRNHVLRELAKKALSEQVMDQAVSFANKTYEMSGNWTDLSFLCTAHVKSNQLQKAHERLTDFIKKNPQHHQARRQLIDVIYKNLEKNLGQNISIENITKSDNSVVKSLYESLKQEMEVICVSSGAQLSDLQFLLSLYQHDGTGTLLDKTRDAVINYAKKEGFNFKEASELDKFLLALPENSQARLDLYQELTKIPACPENIKIKASDLIVGSTTAAISSGQKIVLGGELGNTGGIFVGNLGFNLYKKLKCSLGYTEYCLPIPKPPPKKNPA